MEHLVRSNYEEKIVLEVTPETAGWDFLSFRIRQVAAGERLTLPTGGDEMALVPLAGRAELHVGNRSWTVSRRNVFDEMPHVLYLPPGYEVTVVAGEHFEFAIGGAPAEGRYPVRLFTPAEQKVEVRGGGPAVREVHHTLAWPLPAERLILFEVYVPGGAWSGWPPHCHDGFGGSPYLEETYYYRLQPESGVAFHRNYRLDNDFDEILPARHGDCVLVTEGFHPVAATPGTNVYFLNFLAGEPQDEARNYQPFEDPNTTWIKDNWSGNEMSLPRPWS